MANPTLDWVVRQIELLRTTVESRSRAPQLAHSSFDSGAGHGIEETNPETGMTVSTYGTQFDGSHGAVAFTGPVPPTPTEAVVNTGPELLVAGWDGFFVNADGAPDESIPPTLDFSHVEIHASKDPDFTAEFADTLLNVVSTARGGTTSMVAAPGVWYVRLVARTTTGKRSPASPPVMAVVTVLENTTPAGYTSQITGRGLRVFRTVLGKTIDIIRLGTFGTDYLGISDNNGVPLTSLTGYGDVGAKAVYADKQLYAAGRNMEDTLQSLPQGQVGSGSASFLQTGWNHNASTSRGVVETVFMAKPGRSYSLKIVVDMDWVDQRSKALFFATYLATPLANATISRVTIGNNRVLGGNFPVAPDDYGNRVKHSFTYDDFVPVPATEVEPKMVRVLLVAQRTHTAGTLRIWAANVKVFDQGYSNIKRDYDGITNGLTTTDPTTLPTTVMETTVMPLTTVHHYKRDGGGGYFLAGTANDPMGIKTIKQGRLQDEATGTEDVWKTLFNFGELPFQATLVSVEDIRLIMTPGKVPEGFGTLMLSQSKLIPATVSTAGMTSDDNRNLQPVMELGAWPTGVQREFVFSRRMIELQLLNLNSFLSFVAGGNIEDQKLSTEPKYAIEFPNHAVKLQITYRRTV